MSPQWSTIFFICLNILLVSCARNSSLTFVIDDTGSMYDDIHQITLAAAEIMNIVKTEKTSEIEDVVLVTFNDPDVVLREKTTNADTLLQALRNITVGGGDDCPEYALSGIEKALEESRPNSYLYVFTDASAKDHHKVNNVISLCETKQSQVVFVTTGECEQSDEHGVYQKIANACNGQLFQVYKNEVKDVLEVVKEAVKYRKTIVTSQNIPASATWHKVPFTIDDLSEYVVVSTSGSHIDLVINDSPLSSDTKMAVNEIMWKPSGKVVKFVAPKPGTYYVWVKGDTDVSVLVSAKTRIL